METLEGATLNEKLANFDRMNQRNPIDPRHVEGDFEPQAQTDARVSPLAALGQRRESIHPPAESETPDDKTALMVNFVQNARLKIFDTIAIVDGQEFRLGAETYNNILSAVYDDLIEALKNKKAMLGPSVGREPTPAGLIAPEGPRVRKKQNTCKNCGKPGHNSATCKEKK